MSKTCLTNLSFVQLHSVENAFFLPQTQWGEMACFLLKACTWVQFSSIHISNEQNVSQKYQLCTTTQCRKCLVSCSDTVWDMACFMFKVCNWVQFSSIYKSNEESKSRKSQLCTTAHSVEISLFLAQTQCGKCLVSCSHTVLGNSLFQVQSLHMSTITIIHITT